MILKPDVYAPRGHRTEVRYRPPPARDVAVLHRPQPIEPCAKRWRDHQQDTILAHRRSSAGFSARRWATAVPASARLTMIQHHKQLSLDMLLPEGFGSGSSGVTALTESAVMARSDSCKASCKLAGRCRSLARKPRSTDGLEALVDRGPPGPGHPPQHLLIDGQASLVRLTANGIEWASAHGGTPATGAVPFSEILYIKRVEPCSRTALCCLPVRLGPRLEVHTISRPQRRRCDWQPRTLVLEAAAEEAVQDWAAGISAGIEAVSASRPRSLLVLLNPNSGHRKAGSLYRRVVAPALSGAGIRVVVRETQHVRHAQDIAAQLSAEQVAAIDGIVCVGGDGVFHEAMNGLLEARGAAAAAGNDELAEALSALRLAHIPAGSTDAVACTFHGTRSAFAAVAHLLLGDTTPLDVLRVDIGGRSKFACAMAAYGFLGDVTHNAEAFRWMGPVRYDLLGAVKLLAGRSYPARIRYLEGEVGRVLSRPAHAHAVCGTDCATCRTASFMNSRRRSQQQLLVAGGSSSPLASASPTVVIANGTAAASIAPPPAAAAARPTSAPAAVPAAAAAAAAAGEASGAGQLSPAASGAVSSSERSRHFLQHAAGAFERQGGEGEQWQEIEGVFRSIMLIVMPCRSDKTLHGMARHGHLSDGRLKLVLVTKCSPLQYLRFLLTMSHSGCAPGQLPYVQVLDAVAVAVEPTGGTPSAWNLDGECISSKAIADLGLAAECHQGLLRVFARGVE